MRAGFQLTVRLVFAISLTIVILLMAGCTMEKGKVSGNEQGLPAEQNNQETRSNKSAEFRLVRDKKQLILECEIPRPSINYQDGTCEVKGLTQPFAGYAVPYAGFRVALPQNTTIGKVLITLGPMDAFDNVRLKKHSASPIDGPASALSSVISTKEESVSYRMDTFGGAKSVALSVKPIIYDATKQRLFYSSVATVHIILKDESWDLKQFDSLSRSMMKETVFNPAMVDTYIKK